MIKKHMRIIYVPQMGSRSVFPVDLSIPWTSYSDRTPLPSSPDTATLLGSGSEFDIENKG